MEVARRPGVVPRRDDLHRRELQERGQGDLRQGGQLDDPSKLFNASLDGNVRRAIDLHEGDTLNGSAFKALVRGAVALNRSPGRD